MKNPNIQEWEKKLKNTNEERRGKIANYKIVEYEKL